MKKIIYTGAFRFPDGDAAAFRVQGIGKALRSKGWTVRFAGGEKKERPEDFISDKGTHAYEGFSYHSTGELVATSRSPLRRIQGYLSLGAKTRAYLNSIKAEGIDAVIVYNPLMGYHFHIGIFCRRNRIPMVVDCTEWHEASQYPGGKLGIHRWDVGVSMRLLNPASKNIITISDYLSTYYQAKGANTLQIPPLVDFNAPRWKINRSDRSAQNSLRLVYAGSPGKKDLLFNLLDVVSSLAKKSHRISIDLIGPTPQMIQESLSGRPDLLDQIGTAISIRGRMPAGEIPQELAHYDFGVLLRPNRRYANAGFPTKIVEYLSSGLPVLTNATSDIGKYVRDGREGVLVEDCSQPAIERGLLRMLELSPETRRAMKINAYRQALQSFSYTNYTEDTDNFLTQIVYGKAS